MGWPMPNGQNGILKQSEVGLRILIVAAIVALFAKVFVYDPERYASKGMLLGIKGDLQESIQSTRQENYNRLCDRIGFLEQKLTNMGKVLGELDSKMDTILLKGQPK